MGAQPVVAEDQVCDDDSASQSTSNSTKQVSSARSPSTSRAATAPPVGRVEPSACLTDGGCPAVTNLRLPKQLLNLRVHPLLP